MCSINLYGKAVLAKSEEENCEQFHLENDSGTGDIGSFSVKQVTAQAIFTVWMLNGTAATRYMVAAVRFKGV